MNNKQEISVLEIYMTSLSYLQHHFKLYFGIFSVYMVFSLIPNWTKAANGNNLENMDSVLQIVFMIMSLINIKVFMALIIAIKESIAEHPINIKSSFAGTNKNFWAYFRSTLLVGMIMFIPNFLWLLNSESDSPVVRVLMPILGVTFAIVLHTYYGFAPEIAVVFDEKKRLFHRSHDLVEGYFTKVLLLNLPSILLLFSAFAVNHFIKNAALTEFVYFINLLTVPFFEVATVVMILKLLVIKSKNRETETENN